MVELACNKKFNIDLKRQVRVLVTGVHSYLGNSFAAYAKEHYPNIETHTISLRDERWKEASFAEYDSILHVAGMAHADTGMVDEATQKDYYDINTKLTVDTAGKAKSDGTKQFVFLSSIIVYGDSAPMGVKKLIDENTDADPAGFYGDSKWQGDVGVRELSCDGFKVAVVRPPMVYGKGCKGNYIRLSGLAKSLTFFPYVDNERSMLYIDNFCEFLCKLILSGEDGIYFPQNPEYTNTSDMVKLIGEAHGKKIKEPTFFAPFIKLFGKLPNGLGKTINKVFGNSVYDMKLSVYDGLSYNIYGLRESIFLTEGKDDLATADEERGVSY